MSSRKFSNGGVYPLVAEDQPNIDGNEADVFRIKMDSMKNGHSKQQLNGTHTNKGHEHHEASRKHKTESVAKHGNFHNPYTYEVLLESAEYILSQTTLRPKIAIICGSGLGTLADSLDESVDFPYEEIPHFPRSTVHGHAGKLVFGKMGKVPVACMQGRFHFYEGYPLWKCSMPVRVFKLLGIEMMIVTNAAGGLNPDYKVGDIMIIKDHVNFPGMGGDSALRGLNDERFGPRFIAMNKAYDLELRKLGKGVAADLGMTDFFHEGVYTMVGGPSFETVTELKLMKILCIDAVGMSTVPEVVVARHCGIRCFGFSLITNECILDYDAEDEANHEEVMEAAKKRQNDLVQFTMAFVAAAADELRLHDG